MPFGLPTHSPNYYPGRRAFDLWPLPVARDWQGDGKTIREFQSGIKEATQGFSEEVKSDAPKPRLPKPRLRRLAKRAGKPVQAGVKFCPECGAAQ